MENYIDQCAKHITERFEKAVLYSIQREFLTLESAVGRFERIEIRTGSSFSGQFVKDIGKPGEKIMFDYCISDKGIAIKHRDLPTRIEAINSITRKHLQELDQILTRIKTKVSCKAATYRYLNSLK